MIPQFQLYLFLKSDYVILDFHFHSDNLSLVNVCSRQMSSYIIYLHFLEAFIKFEFYEIMAFFILFHPYAENELILCTYIIIKSCFCFFNWRLSPSLHPHDHFHFNNTPVCIANFLLQHWIITVVTVSVTNQVRERPEKVTQQGRLVVPWIYDN